MFRKSHNIPLSDHMNIVKLDGTSLNANTCNSARKTSRGLGKVVVEAAKEAITVEGREEQDPIVLQQDCHHHLRNVWMGAITKHLSKYLDKILTTDLKEIDFRYRVSTDMDAVLRAVDKEFMLPANYPKGHGDHFKHWLKSHHPGALLVLVLCATGSRQDLACEGTGAVFWNRR